MPECHRQLLAQARAAGSADTSELVLGETLATIGPPPATSATLAHRTDCGRDRTPSKRAFRFVGRYSACWRRSRGREARARQQWRQLARVATMMHSLPHFPVPHLVSEGRAKLPSQKGDADEQLEYLGLELHYEGGERLAAAHEPVLTKPTSKEPSSKPEPTAA
jgi:hypothetical protein